MLYTHHAGHIIPRFFPRLTWQKPTEEKVIYLTFDDGPVPVVTEFVLEQLHLYDAKATFFCVGDNIVKHPEIFAKILAEGHRIGNHTHNHINGWQHDNEVYYENIIKCDEAITQSLQELNLPFVNLPRLFRPPYGKITPLQVDRLINDYEIVMWTVLSGDFDVELAPSECLEKTIYHTNKGAIIVFHDSVKAEKNLTFALPRYLDFFASRGYRFATL
jgi:peptidoglycan/xylan/chitin deacetylase (PgdA/CDA1 family)